MSSTSNKLSQSNMLLAEKPINEASNIQEVLKINGITLSVKNYALSSEEQNKLISEIQSALNDHNHVIDDDEKLRLVINTIMKHCFELLEMKTRSATTGERNLWWIGGFCPSQLLKVILTKLQHLCTQQQLSDIYNLGQSCQQAEYALAQGMVKLLQNLDKATTPRDKGFQLTYVTQQLSFFKEVQSHCPFVGITFKARALYGLAHRNRHRKKSDLETFSKSTLQGLKPTQLSQADNLRQQFLHQFSCLLTISQQAEFVVALKEHLHNPQPRSSL